MSLNTRLSEQLFLIEMLVHKVHLRAIPECKEDCLCPNVKRPKEFPLRVRVKFISFPCVEINQREFSDTNASKPKDEELKKKIEQDPGHFGTGKSFLFPMAPYDLIRGLKHYPLAVTVLQYSPEEYADVLGVTQVSLGLEEVCETIRRVNECEQVLPISSTVKDAYDLVNLDGEYVGYIVMLVRLSCFGQSIVTQFQLTEERSYLFRNTRPEEPFPCDKCDGNLDYDADTYDIIPAKPFHCFDEDIHDMPCCEAAREGLKVERRTIEWNIPKLKVDDNPFKKEEVFKPTRHYQEYEPEDQVVFVNNLTESFQSFLAEKLPCTCLGREPLSMPEPEELIPPAKKKPTIVPMPIIPWDSPTTQMTGPPGTVAARVPTLDAPPGAVARPGTMPSPYGLGRPRGFPRRVGAVPPMAPAQFMSRVGALPGFCIKGDRRDWLPVGYVPPNPQVEPIIPDALPATLRPNWKLTLPDRTELGYPQLVLRLTGGGAGVGPEDCEPDHKWVDESTPTTKSRSHHSAHKDPWAPGGPWGPDGPWGASKGKQPNPPIRYDTTSRLTQAFEASFPAKKRHLPPRVVVGTLNNRKTNPPIRYDTTGLLSGYCKAAHKAPLPTDVGEAVDAIKKGHPATLKELQSLLERVKNVEHPKNTTIFRPSGRYSYEWGSRYPGTYFGHRNCAPLPKRVPKIKGWCWDTRVPIYRVHDYDTGDEGANWRPGAICNSLKRTVRAPRRALRPFGIAPGPRKLSVIHMPLSTDKLQGDSPEEPFVPTPTLHVHRYQGDFFVSMHPDDMTGDSEPLQFRIVNKDKKPITCQDSESELEIEVFQTGAFITNQNKTYCDEKTQCEDRYFPKDEKKKPPVDAPPPEDKGKKGKSGKGKKGKKGKK